MFFWIKTVTLYLIVACGGLALAVVLSFLTIVPLASDDSPGLGFIWGLVFLAEAALLIPLSLALTAELVERKAQKRQFSFLKVLARFAVGWMIPVGPLYTAIYVYPYVESRKPAQYVEMELALYILSGASAILALRIRRAQAID